MFQKFSSMETNFWIRDGGYHVFSWEIFRLTMSKNFVGENFNVSEIFGYRKIL